MLNLDDDLTLETPVLTGTIEPPAHLIKVEPANAELVFTDPQAIHPLVKQVADLVATFKPDTSTAKGRKEIASFAYRIASTKSYLDKMGAVLVAKYKELPRLIDANRKTMRDQLDALRDQARKPLDEWEAEQERIAAEQKAKEAAEKLAQEVEVAHELALLMDAEHNRKREEAMVKAEQERLAREERIRQEAAERARIEAEARAKAEHEATLRREIEAKLAQERAEREKVEAEERAKRAEQEKAEAAARAEEARIKAEKEAAERLEREKQAAVEAERKRQEAQAAAVEAERVKREADLEHRRTFNREALEAIRNALAENDDPAVSILTAIVQGRVPHVKLEY